MALIVILFLALEFFMWWFLEQHYWLIPAVLVFNVFGTWLLTNTLILRGIVFPYSSSLITSQVTR